MKDYNKVLNLVLTPKSSISESKKDEVFAGQWCISPFIEDIDELKKYQFLEYHWNDRSKLKDDHDYLGELYERILSSVSKNLNKIHKTSKSIKYWRIIIGPWLIPYISVLYDRWEVLSKLSDGKKYITNIKESDYVRKPPKDYNEALVNFRKDQFNHDLFSSILSFRKFRNVELNFINNSISETSFINNISTSSYKKKRYKLIKELILSLLDKIASFINKHIFRTGRNLTIYHSYFPRTFQLILGLKLKNLPRMHKHFKSNYASSSEIWSIKILNNFEPKEEFEFFIANRINKDIPKSYIEDFGLLLSIQEKIPYTKIIFTANGHFNDDIFKIWLAEAQNLQSKILISAHGGGLYPRYSVFNHQELISDIRIVWGKEWLKNQLRMPPNKLSLQNLNFSKNSNISLITYNSWKYSVRLVAQPMGIEQSKYLLEQWIELKRNLNPALLKFLKIKPSFEGKINLQSSLDIKKLSFAFGSENLLTNSNINDVIKSSKIMVCTYPQTTFSESMFSDVPTILLIKESFFEVESIFDELVVLLKESKIFHNCPISAADHLNEIYADPGLWWNSNQTVKAREMYKEICLTPSKNRINEWTQLFKSQFKENS